MDERVSFGAKMITLNESLATEALSTSADMACTCMGGLVLGHTAEV
jgi:hypothetical protein